VREKILHKIRKIQPQKILIMKVKIKRDIGTNFDITKYLGWNTALLIDKDRKNSLIFFFSKNNDSHYIP